MPMAFSLKLYLLLAIAAPSLFSGAKLILLLFLLFSSMFLLWNDRVKFDVRAFIFLWVFLAYLLISVVQCEVGGYEFSFGQIRNFVLNFVAALLIGVSYSRFVGFYDIHRLLINSTILIVGLLFFYSTYVLIGFYLMPSELGAIAYGHYFGGVVLSDDRLQIRSIAQTPLIFLSTYCLIYFSHLKDKKINLPRAVFFLMLIFVVAASGRRALQLAFVLSLLYLFVVYVIHARNNLMSYIVLSLCVGIVLVIVVVNVSTFAVIWGTFLDGFNIESNSAGLKYEQFFPLYDHWSKSPLFGNGLYSYPEGYVRSVDYKYSFELVYLAVLGQIGVVGFFYLVFLFVFALIKIYFNKDVCGVCEARNPIVYSYISSSIVFFVMGSSNPMIYMNWFWVILVLLASQSGRVAFRS